MITNAFTKVQNPPLINNLIHKCGSFALDQESKAAAPPSHFLKSWIENFNPVSRIQDPGSRIQDLNQDPGRRDCSRRAPPSPSSRPRLVSEPGKMPTATAGKNWGHFANCCINCRNRLANLSNIERITITIKHYHGRCQLSHENSWGHFANCL